MANCGPIMLGSSRTMEWTLGIATGTLEAPDRASKIPQIRHERKAKLQGLYGLPGRPLTAVSTGKNVCPIWEDLFPKESLPNC
jgi:hypothetical protein